MKIYIFSISMGILSGVLMSYAQGAQNYKTACLMASLTDKTDYEIDSVLHQYGFEIDVEPTPKQLIINGFLKR